MCAMEGATISHSILSAGLLIINLKPRQSRKNVVNCWNYDAHSRPSKCTKMRITYLQPYMYICVFVWGCPFQLFIYFPMGDVYGPAQKGVNLLRCRNFYVLIQLSSLAVPGGRIPDGKFTEGGMWWKPLWATHLMRTNFRHFFPALRSIFA